MKTWSTILVDNDSTFLNQIKEIISEKVHEVKKFMQPIIIEFIPKYFLLSTEQSWDNTLSDFIEKKATCFFVDDIKD
jgi:hypothetical protein